MKIGQVVKMKKRKEKPGSYLCFQQDDFHTLHNWTLSPVFSRKRGGRIGRRAVRFNRSRPVREKHTKKKVNYQLDLKLKRRPIIIITVVF